MFDPDSNVYIVFIILQISLYKVLRRNFKRLCIVNFQKDTIIQRTFVEGNSLEVKCQNVAELRGTYLNVHMFGGEPTLMIVTIKLGR